ncbi:MAG: low molecular weight protein-tyrosine-phosphatase [Edaphocola sp.]
MKILMVCLGNICRSPIAEGVMQHIANQRNLNWQIDSAGTERYHIGEPPHRYSQKICQKYGIDISGQRARQITRADLERYDLVYAMATDVMAEIKYMAGTNPSSGKVKLFLEEKYPGQNRNVPDPWYGPEDGFVQVYDLIADNCAFIADKYASQS